MLSPLRISTLLPKQVIVTDGSMPRKEYRAHFSPPTTLSRRKEGFLFSLRKALTGVSVSPSISLYTGMRLPCRESSLNCARWGYNISRDASLPAHDIGVFSVTARLAVPAVGIEVVLSVGSGILVNVGFAPGISGHEVFLEIGTLPLLYPGVYEQ